MNGIQDPDHAMVAAARELYLKYEGHQHRRIEREMRAAGWSFYKELLFSIQRDYGVRPGWIERFGWIELLPEHARKGLRLMRAGRNHFENWLQKERPDWDWRWKYQRYIYRHLN